MVYLIALICVLGIAAGQLLFKMSALEFKGAYEILNYKAVMYLLGALALYGVTTIGWVWVLQKIDLGKVYPLMALSFVVVPLASYFLFGERFQYQYYIGVSMIVIGIVVSFSA